VLYKQDSGRRREFINGAARRLVANFAKLPELLLRKD
jgi:hypothetical protein